MSDINIGLQLGLGEMWQPSPAGWRFAEIMTSNGQKMHVLVFVTSAGTFGVVLDDAALRNLASQCLQQASGIVMPNGPIPPQ